MTDTIQILRERMEAAAEALDYEEAKRLRDRISLMRGGATSAEAEQADVSGLFRQRPGAMGLGTSQQPTGSGAFAMQASRLQGKGIVQAD